MQPDVDKYQGEASQDSAPIAGRVGDVILSVLCIAGGIAVWCYSSTLPSPPGGAFGPGLFPGILGMLGVIFGILVGVFALFRIIRARLSQGPNVKANLVSSSSEDTTVDSAQVARWLDVIVALSSIAFYLLFAE